MKQVKAKLLRAIRGKPEAQAGICVLSYPKTGRTWLRALMGKYFSIRYALPDERIFSSKLLEFGDSRVPTIFFGHCGSEMLARTNYEALHIDFSAFRDKCIILLGRDPKDTLVSAYFQATKRICVFDGTISEFVRSDEFGIKKYIAFYGLWAENQNIPREFLFLTYEQLHSYPEAALTRVLLKMGEGGIDERALESSISWSSFNNLKRAEQDSKFRNGRLQVGAKGDPESFKVRRGGVGRFAEYLSPADIKYIDEEMLKHQILFTRS